MVVMLGILEGCGMMMFIPLLRSVGLNTGRSMLGSEFKFLGNVRELVSSMPLGGLLAMLFVFVTGQALLRMILARLNVRLVADFTHYLRDRLHQALVAADWAVFLRLRGADVVRILTQEVNVAAQGLDGLTSAATVAAQLAVLSLIAFIISPTVTLIALVVTVLSLLVMNRFSKRVHEENNASISGRGALAANISGHLGGLKLAKSHAAESRPAESFKGISEELGDRRVSIIGVQSKMTATLTIGAAFALCLMVWVAVEKQEIQGGQLAFIAIIGIRFVSRLNALQAVIHRLSAVIPAFQETEKLRRKWQRAAEPESIEDSIAINLETALVLDHVTYRYPGSKKDALSNLTLNIPSHSTTALCGHSGAGKSTLADLTLGLIPPTDGSIAIDGVKLEGSAIRNWRRSVAYVPQDVFLLHDTLRENLLWLSPEATEEDMWAALENAVIDDFVRQLPDGLDTVVGERGVRLSGGERQRIALARALLRKPTLMVLDEATSSLDNTNERLIKDAIDRLRGSMTILIIAHRLSTIRHADQIAVLNEGRVVQLGSWKELAEAESETFAQMITTAAI